MALPEPWLRGPIPGIPALLQPVAHALVLSVEDCERSVAGLEPDEIWQRPGGAASLGFHLTHLAGSTDRLLTYARGQTLSEAQLLALRAEQAPAAPLPSGDQLVAAWRATVDRALEELAGTAETTLLDARRVGRAGLPSTVLGLLFHAAEHAARHTGQVVTTARIVRSAAGA